LGKDQFEKSDLPKINPLKLLKLPDMLLEFANSVPDVPKYYMERYENK